jgi:chemotaxis regulatin CheY-phosphate phosphatase CheZ
MKIMDINEEQMEIANDEINCLTSFITGEGDENLNSLSSERLLEVINRQMDVLKKINDLGMRMMEPLSFQDLVGQRIQKIVKLIRTMETRIEDIIVTFGIKVMKHREDPDKSFDDLSKEVEDYRSELKSPQRKKEGLDQAAIDELLAAMQY